MNVLIVGSGEVGFHTADRLSREGHSVTVIERNPERERLLQEKANVLVVHGSGASVETLERAGVREADLFIAVTDQDEVNLVSCILANEFDVPRKIARVRNIEFHEGSGRFDPRKLGVDLLINPQSAVAEEFLHIIRYSSARDAGEFSDGRVVFLGYPIEAGSPLAGLSLRDLGEMRGMYRLVITAITRDDHTIVPRGDDTIAVGDTVYLVCRREDLPSIEYLFGLQRQDTRRVFILGAGRVGNELTSRLQAEGGHRLTIIERDRARAEALAESCPSSVLVLNADGLDADTLRQEGVGSADLYLAVTDDDRTNILAALLAKRIGARRVLALVNQPELLGLATSLGVDACVSPRLATASAILKHLRRGVIHAMAVLQEADAEVLEFVLPTDCRHLDTPLADLDVPEGTNIGAIVRQQDGREEILIPGGDDELRAGDHVIVFAQTDAVAAVGQFLGSP